MIFSPMKFVGFGCLKMLKLEFLQNFLNNSLINPKNSQITNLSKIPQTNLAQSSWLLLFFAISVYYVISFHGYLLSVGIKKFMC
jgi:hypothetical protein